MSVISDKFIPIHYWKNYFGLALIHCDLQLQLDGTGITFRTVLIIVVKIIKGQVQKKSLVVIVFKCIFGQSYRVVAYIQMFHFLLNLTIYQAADWWSVNASEFRSSCLIWMNQI